MRALTAIAGVLLVLVGAVVWLTTTTRRAEPAEPLVLEADPGEFAPDEGHGTELADPDAPIDAPLSDEGSTEEARIALLPEPKPSAPDTIDRSKKTAPLEFAVIDERSGLPLPRFLVRLADSAGRTLEVVTNERGEGKTEPIALGPVTAYPFDHERRPRPAKLAIDHIERPSRPHVVSVASGPTYRVRLTPQPGLDPSAIDLRITLDNEDGDSATTNLDPLRAHEPYLHEGEEPWVRFQALDATLTRAGRIDARSRDGLWSGFGKATVAVGEAVQPVQITLEARGVVKGKVTSNGAPAAGVVVVFRAEAKSKQEQPYVTSTRTDVNGVYRIEFVRPRDATLRLTSLFCEPMSRNVSLHSGETLVEDFELAALPTVGRIAGTIVSETGTYEPRVELTLVRAGNDRGDVPQLRARAQWKTVEGRRVGAFDFGLVPKGKYRVDFGRNDWFEWTPRRVDVEAPKEDVVVRIADRALVADFAFDVRDADNGIALNRCHLVLETIDGERMKWFDSGDVVVWAYPEDKRLRWRLDKPGYPSRIGDVKSFEVTTLVDGRRRRTCEIQLQPGWSEMIHVTYGKEEKPIEGALVKLDGAEAGKTDKNGLLRVSAREKPKSITVELAGWRMDGGVDMRSPAQRNWRRYVEVHMRQTKKK